jgi:hypothetical protein
MKTMATPDIKDIDLKPIFFGSPSCVEESVELHRYLDRAMLIASGLQQPGHPDSEEAAKQEEEAYRQGQEQLAFNLYIIVRRLGAEKLVYQMLKSTLDKP